MTEWKRPPGCKCDENAQAKFRCTAQWMRCNARIDYCRRMPHVTKTQRALIQEGVLPRRYLYGSGSGIVVGDPRTIRELRKKALAIAHGPGSTSWYDQRCKAWLTKLAYELVGAPPPQGKHPYDVSREWP